MSDLISVIVPVYNAEATLERCENTVLAQTSSAFELILVDDGSTDGSGEICDRIAAEHPDRVRVIHKENGGVSSARNTGIEAATGKYVVFVDADDTVSDNLVYEIARTAEQSEFDLLTFGAEIEKCDGSFSSVTSGAGTYHGDLTEAILAFAFPGIYTPSNSNLHFAPQVWGKAFRREIISGNGIHFDETLRKAEDFLFNLDYLPKCRSVVMISESLYQYHYTQNSIMRSYTPPREIGIDKSVYIYSEMDKILRKNDISCADYHKLLSSRFIRIIIDGNVGIVANLQEKYEQRKYIRNTNHWFFEYINKYGLSLERPAGLKFRLESFMVRHRLIEVQRQYAKLMLKHHE